MGIEYALVNDDDRAFIRLGKKVYAVKDGDDPSREIDYLGFQIHDEKIGRFLANAGPRAVLRLIPDAGSEYDELREGGYALIDEWSAGFESRRDQSP